MVYGGGGIVPDLLVGAVAPTAHPRALSRLLAGQSGTADAVLDSLRTDLEPQVASGIAIQPAWRMELVRRFRNAGIELTDSLAAGAGDYLDQLIAGRAGLFVVSDSARFLSGATQDPQVERARRLLIESRSQRELLAAAARKGKAG